MELTYFRQSAIRTYFRQLVVGFKTFQNNVLFYQEPEPAPDKKIPGAGPKQDGSETLHIRIRFSKSDPEDFYMKLSKKNFTL